MDEVTAEVVEPVFLEYCRWCRRKHLMTMHPCPTCGGRGGWIPMPRSEAVYEKCGALYQCDGCAAYADHLR